MGQDKFFWPSQEKPFWVEPATAQVYRAKRDAVVLIVPANIESDLSVSHAGILCTHFECLGHDRVAGRRKRHMDHRDDWVQRLTEEHDGFTVKEIRV